MLPSLASRGGLALATGLVLFAALSASGCRERETTSTVHGSVSLNGKPVTDGMVVFVSEADPSVRVPGQVFGDGKYTAMGIPVGPVKVYFDMSEPKKWEEAKAKTQAKGASKRPRPPIGGPGAVPPGPYVPIPARYESPETSELRYVVEPGITEINFELR
jgi:hypothetical protein